MKTITLRKENLKRRKDIGKDWYEWEGFEGKGNIKWDGFNIILTRGGNLDTEGGNLNTRGGNLNTGGGYLDTEGGYLDTGGGYLYTRGGYLDTEGGNLNTGGGNLKCRNLYWQLMSMPTCKKMEIRQIRPPGFQRKYWEKRTGLKLKGCYSEVYKTIKLEIPKLLRKKCWSETERWILNSWK